MLPVLAGCYVAGTAAAAAGGAERWALLLLVSAIAALAAITRGVTSIAVALGAIALGAAAFARYEVAAAAPPSALASVAGVHTLEGVVRADPLIRGTFARFDVYVDTLDGRATEGTVRVTAPFSSDRPREGDRVRLTGTIEAAAPATPAAASESSAYAQYLRGQGIEATVAFPRRLEVLARDTGTAPARWLRALRQTLIEHIERSLPEPESSLAVGMLIGRQGTLPPQLASDLRATGTTHLVVVSGQNVALVLGALTSLLGAVLSRRLAALLALGALPGYVLLVGPEPPVVRAAIMAIGVTLGTVSGRRTPGFVFLAYALALMLAIDPRLATSVSFQLSATATWGVIVLAPALTTGLSRALRQGEGSALIPPIEALATATAAFASVLPVQARVFGNLPLAAIPANVLATPLYGATLLVAGVAALLGGIDAVADTMWRVGVLAPRLFVDLVHALGGWGMYALPAGEPVLLAIACFGVLLGIVWWAQPREHTRLEGAARGRVARVRPVLVGAAALAAAVLSASGMGPLVSAPPRVTVLDVGQGLAVLVRDGGAAVLIDAGPPDGSALRALPRGTARDLEALVVTHADVDHTGGAEEVARRMRVAHVLGASPPSPAPLEARMLALGERINVGPTTTIEVLSPPPEALGVRDSENDRSLVMLVTAGGQRVLVAADIEAAAERWLVNTGRDLRAKALVVPHHGSRTSSTPAFIEAVAPSTAVISAGPDNRFGHPHPEVVHRYEAAGVRVLNTAERGSVTLTAHAGALEVTTER